MFESLDAGIKIQFFFWPDALISIDIDKLLEVGSAAVFDVSPVLRRNPLIVTSEHDHGVRARMTAQKLFDLVFEPPGKFA